MTTIFEQLLSEEYYQELLLELSPEEREVALKALRELTETFEKNIIKPILKLNDE